jgi:ABC-type sugar transport system permease subunit
MKKKKNSTLVKLENRQGWLSIIPVFVMILGIRAYPIGVGIVKSFTNWDGLFRNDFIGFGNYLNTIKSGQFWSLLLNNVILLSYLPFQTLLGLAVAILFYEKTPGRQFFRACYYIPQILSTVIVGYMFVIFFGFNGPVNTILRAVNLERFALDWMGKRGSAMFIIVLCMVWINIGWQGMLFLGGMASIPSTVFEAAVIDGAGYWTRLFRITLPMLVRVLEYSTVVSVSWCFTGLFGIIYTMTKGGPGYDTTTVDYMIYIKAFRGGSELGYGSAIAVLLTMIVIVFTLIQMKLAKRADDWS